MSDGMIEVGVPENSEDLREQEEAYAALADSVRELVEGCVRTRLAPQDARAAAERVREISAGLLAEAQEGPLGLEVCSDGRLRDHGNPAVGSRNPIAPPLRVRKHADGRAEVEVHLGAAYEGPPDHVHGGIIALVLDQVLGTSPAAIGKPGMTAYLNLTYRRPTPLGQVGARAWVAEEHPFKTLVRGELLDADGKVTVEAEGLFVVPRWARGALDAPQSDAGDFPAP